uniref:BTB domain-containing protein n=1 Tax=Panagrolaimus sp. ES5 TaxID=591445 RepID=A0AC34F6X1_9BILA
MAYVRKCKIAVIWSVKKDTFLNQDNLIRCENVKTTVPGFECNFLIQQDEFGNVGIYYGDCCERESTIKEMTLSIPSANFLGDLSVVPAVDVPKDSILFGVKCTIIKREDILNPENQFFINGILTLNINGIIESKKEPIVKSLGATLWDSNDDKDFTFHFGKSNFKAHKIILCVYSSELSNLIKSNVNQIRLDDFNYGSVKNVIQCCYGLPPTYLDARNLIASLEFVKEYNFPLIEVSSFCKVLYRVIQEKVRFSFGSQ